MIWAQTVWVAGQYPRSSFESLNRQSRDMVVRLKPFVSLSTHSSLIVEITSKTRAIMPRAYSHIKCRQTAPGPVSTCSRRRGAEQWIPPHFNDIKWIFFVILTLKCRKLLRSLRVEIYLIAWHFWTFSLLVEVYWIDPLDWHFNSDWSNEFISVFCRLESQIYRFRPAPHQNFLFIFLLVDFFPFTMFNKENENMLGKPNSHPWRVSNII